MNLDELIEKGREVVDAREEDADELGLAPEFMEGFREGVAELIAALTGEAAADVLEQITD